MSGWGWGAEVTQPKGSTTQTLTYQLSGEGQTERFWPSSQLTGFKTKGGSKAEAL